MDAMPQAQYDFIKGIQDYMLKASNMDEHEAWDFGFRIWQFETWLYKYMTEDRGRNAKQTEQRIIACPLQEEEAEYFKWLYEDEPQNARDSRAFSRESHEKEQTEARSNVSQRIQSVGSGESGWK